MNKTMLLAVAAVVAISAGGAASAARAPRLGTKGLNLHATRLSTPNSPGSVVLYSQNNDTGGASAGSQKFEPSMAQLDDQGADDFIVPAGKTWIVKEVDVTGVYRIGSSPATSENVYFYTKGKNELPGAQIGSTLTRKGTDNGTGSFAIKFGKGNAVTLKGGTGGKTYWVSVQANCNYQTCGQWFWTTTYMQHGYASAWQNPGHGWGICPTWGTTLNCIGYGPDYMFGLKGASK